eukprot:scaffold15248_cov115-Isochrysis_galbana.AAC.4
MNEVSELAQDLNIPITYTDTDSFHIQRSGIPTLNKAFQERYGRAMVGKDLGQLHSDFNDLVKYEEGSGVEVYASQSIILAKKAYCDVLRDTLGNTGLHFRMKSVKDTSIQKVADADFGGDVASLYRYLSTGKPLWFEMQSFKRMLNRSMQTVVIRRRIQFTNSGCMLVDGLVEGLADGLVDDEALGAADVDE